MIDTLGPKATETVAKRSYLQSRVGLCCGSVQGYPQGQYLLGLMNYNGYRCGNEIEFRPKTCFSKLCGKQFQIS